MTDILAFIAGASSSALFFMLGAFFGAAYHKANATFTTPDGMLTFDLIQLAKILYSMHIKVEELNNDEEERVQKGQA